MIAYRCDRCGKLYELTPEQTKMRSRGVNYGIHNSLNSYYLDLCEKCFYELQEWMTVYIEAENKRDCKTCIHSDNGRCAYTEECHECMWESQYEADAESEEKSMYRFFNDSEDEEKILDEAYDLMFGNIPDIDVTIANMAIDDEEDAESEDK